MQVKKEIIINASPEKVWDIFSDIERWPEICDYISKVQWTSETRWNLNSTFQQVVKNIVPFRNLVSNAKIISINPGKSVTWCGSRKLIRGFHTLNFEGLNEQTKVINIEKFKGPLAPILFPFIKRRFERYFEQFLIGLKREVEK